MKHGIRISAPWIAAALLLLLPLGAALYAGTRPAVAVASPSSQLYLQTTASSVLQTGAGEVGAQSPGATATPTVLQTGAGEVGAQSPGATATPTVLQTGAGGVGAQSPGATATPTASGADTTAALPADTAATTDLGGRPLTCITSAAPPSPAGSAPAVDAAAPISQTFLLQPGWNAIYLELAPQQNRIAEALAGLPVGCVFSHRGQPDRPPRAYQPASAEATNLYTLEANQAYLVRLEGKEAVTWNVYGRPVLGTPAWTAGQFNELGLPVDPANPPTFARFFAASAAHAELRVQRLETSGRWVAVDAGQTIRAGEAYRIFSAGPSAFGGPFTVTADRTTGLEFGRTLVQRSLRIRNTTDAPLNLVAGLLPSAAPVPLLYRYFDPAAATEFWTPFTDARWMIWLPQDILAGAGEDVLAPGAEIELRLAVRRGDLPPGVDLAESVLEIIDATGARTLVAISAQPQLAAEADPAADPAAAGAYRNAAYQHAGLWIGTVAVNRVGAANPLAADMVFDLELALLSEQVSSAAAGGGAAPVQETVRDVVVAAGSPWQYWAAGEPGADWAGPGFGAAGWREGAAPLGFGRSVATEIAAEPSVLYLRKTFNLPAKPDGSAGLELRLRRDDGAIVYLNGVEVLRSNMPAARVSAAGEAAFQIYASQGTAGQPFGHPNPASLLVQGDNVLAAEVHRYAGEQGGAADDRPEPTASEFRFRVLIHVDAAGQPRLLKEAILMRDPVSGKDVLLSDAALASGFTGAGLRDGQPVGRRVSTAAYDFAGPDPAMPGTVEMWGEMTEWHILGIDLDLAADLPTNPFLHRYHPDHDNLKDGTGEPLPAEQAEAYAVRRELRFTFTDPETAGSTDPGWGDTVLGGIYEETIAGLNRQPLSVEGTFTLTRASNIAVLNPQPARAQ